MDQGGDCDLVPFFGCKSGRQVDKCSFVPSDVAPMEYTQLASEFQLRSLESGFRTRSLTPNNLQF